MINRLRHMLIKEFIQMFRDPRMRRIVLVMPLIQMMVIAFAMNTDVTRIATGILDSDNTPETREIVSDFVSGGYFSIKTYANSTQELTEMLDRGEIKAALHFPAGFTSDLQSGKTAHLQLFADGTQSTDASAISGYAEEIVGRFSKKILKNTGAGSISIEARAWFNPNIESRFYYVPALIAVMLLIVSMLMASIGIVREKEIGTIEQVMVTPIRKIEFILGKTIPYLATGFITMTTMFIMARIVFGVVIHGNILLLYILTGIYISGNLGISLIISAASRTQQQALLTAFLVMLPSVLLSGFIFPVRNMPPEIQCLTWLNPMRWFLEIVRGIVLKGSGPSVLAKPMIMQLVLAVLFIAIAVRRFKKTLE